MIVPASSPIRMPAITAAPPTNASARPSRRPMRAADWLTVSGWSFSNDQPARVAARVGASDVGDGATGACAAAGCESVKARSKAPAKGAQRESDIVILRVSVRLSIGPNDDRIEAVEPALVGPHLP